MKSNNKTQTDEKYGVKEKERAQTGRQHSSTHSSVPHITWGGRGSGVCLQHIISTANPDVKPSQSQAPHTFHCRIQAESIDFRGTDRGANIPAG